MSTKVLCDAIAERSTVSFNHEGGRYTVEPYSVGYEQRDQHGHSPLLLRAWHDNGWRDFQVKYMSSVAISGSPFSADRAGHQRMLIVLCDVSGKTWSGN